MSSRAGFIALVGLPNAGKSTLLNRLLGAPLSIVSPHAQTTRHRILGIVEGESFQAAFLDTPGWLTPDNDLQRAMLAHARRGIAEDADLACLVVEPGPLREPGGTLLDALSRAGVPVVLAVNKADAAPPGGAEAAEAAVRSKLSPAASFRLSARTGQGVAALLKGLVERLPEHEPYYPKGQQTDRWERFFVAECAREAVFELYRDELPYACAVEVEEFRERRDGPDEVELTLHVEREGQKGILIGQGGRALGRLRERAEASAAKLLGRKLRLSLRVKVWKDWRRDPEALKRLGYLP